MTVDEYLRSSKSKQRIYRAFRNPIIMLTIGPVFVIALQNRIPNKQMPKKAIRNVHFTNLMIVLMAAGISLLIGVKAFLLIQLPVILFAHIFGIALFYVQHQFDDVDWKRNTKWDYNTAAIKGSSFLKLPRVLQWFTGNIGFHHVHHLSSRIPNYKLAQCHSENDLFSDVKPIRITSALLTFRLKLYDEALCRMVSFKKLNVSAR
jgi:omega-6 fatty acid desaturase (delta-12 desaturase)